MPLATVKFYLREGLLPPGVSGRPGRAYYDESHLRRLSLIRSLQQLAGLPLSTIRGLLSAIDSASGDVVRQVAPTIDALMPEPAEPPSPELRRAASMIDEALLRWGLKVRPGAAARGQLARSLLSFSQAFDKEVSPDALTPYLEALRPITRAEIEAGAQVLAEGGDRAVELSLLGTILWEPAIVALRRLLHEHWAAELHGPEPRSAPRGKPASKAAKKASRASPRRR